MELIKVWRKGGFTLRLWDTFRTDSLGKTILAYSLKDGRKEIFKGSDFCRSPMHAIDSLDTVASLLCFLSLQDGDTDSEYFSDYSAEQIAWRDSGRCDELKMIQIDMEEACK